MDSTLEYLKNMLFRLKAEGWDITFQKVAFLLLLSALVFYVIYLTLTKAVFSKSGKYSRDQLLQLNMHRTLTVIMIVFAAYTFFLFRENGIAGFEWSKPSFYQAILPQLLVFVGVIATYVLSEKSILKKLTNR